MKKDNAKSKNLLELKKMLESANYHYVKYIKEIDNSEYSKYLKDVTDLFEQAIKSKDVDGILKLEATCEKIDSNLISSMNNVSEITQQTRMSDIFSMITNIWEISKNQKVVEEMYAEDIKRGDLNRLAICSITPYIKRYRADLKKIPGQLASTIQRNYYLKRIKAMGTVKKEYIRNIEKILGIVRTPKKDITK